MGHHLNDETLYLIVDAKKAADMAAQHEAERVLERWAREVVEECARGNAPQASLNFDEVALLTSAYGEVLGVDHVTRRATSWLSIAWRQKHTPFATILWSTQAYDVPDGDAKQGIQFTAKVFAA